MALATTNLSPKAKCVQFGYGQVEPNHLSARTNGQIYAQLPVAADIDLLENGQFAKYDYAKGVVDFDTDAGEWLLVFNEVKVYEDYQTDADFAMKKENYEARVYNAVGNSSYSHYNVQNKGDGSDDLVELDVKNTVNGGMMPANTTMVPRLLRTQPGDIMTTNCIVDAYDSLNVGTKLKIGADGYLSTSGTSDDEWVVVQKYNMPDLQPGVKIRRVK